jgi:type VI secretion system secreted protein VgrG
MAKDYLSMRLETDDFDASGIDIHRVTGREAISQLFEYQLHIVHKGDQLKVEDVVGACVALVYDRGEEEVRRVHGMISEVVDEYATEDDFWGYRLTVVPRAWRMTQVETLEIYLDMTVPEIIQKKLELVDLATIGSDYELRLTGEYPTREFVVQYKETDLNFIARLTEHLGISYFFEHGEGQDSLIFSDNPAGFHDIEGGDPQLTYNRRGEEGGVYQLETKRKLIPRVYVCRDYNYRTPTVELQSTHDLETGDAGALIEYGGHFKNGDDGADLAKVRAQEKESTRIVHKGDSDAVEFGAGALFELGGHPGVEGRLLLTEIEMSHSQTIGTGVGAGDERTYRNSFRAIDAGLTYRPPRAAEIPRIYGVITGLVETDGQGSVGKYAKIDDEGRYVVKFLFDTAPPGERKASRPVRRIQPTVGPNYGMHFPLRPGIEVLITFIDGDPDRPLIVGAVPNPVTPTPVDAGISTKNRIKTESGVLFEIEDGAGA